MSKKYLNSVDLNQNELLNARIQNIAGVPGSPVAGQIWFNTSTNRIEFRGSASNIDPTARANHTGTQTASTISDFDTQVRVSRLDQLAAPTASVSLNSQKITNLLDGTATQDAATYGQLLGIANGTDWKNSVRIATTANIATLTGLAAIDGVTPVANDRVLVKNQTTQTQNGLYLASAGAWSRTIDADASIELTTNTAVMVEEGTTNAGTQWRLSTTGAITIGSTNIVFTQFGAGSAYVQGSGITISGNSIAIDPAVVTRKYAVTIGDNTSTSITVTHNLGTQDVISAIRDASTNAEVGCDVVNTSTTQTTFTFASAPATNSLRVVVLG
jgi:phage-related tail fiber protein